MSVVVRLRTEGDPEIEVHADDALDASQQLKELRDAGAFSALKTIGREYKEAPEAGLESVHDSFPDARVIAEGKAAELNRPVAQPHASPDAPNCQQCGRPMNAERRGANGFFRTCSSGIKTHTVIVGK